MTEEETSKLVGAKIIEVVEDKNWCDILVLDNGMAIHADEDCTFYITTTDKIQRKDSKGQ